MSAATYMTVEMATTGLDRQVWDESYITAPMQAVKPLPPVLDEEELHTQFEQALSYRTTALHDRLARLSDPALYTPIRPEPQTEPVALVNQPAKTHKHVMLYLVGALFFLLLGFNLMGLLVLSLH